MKRFIWITLIVILAGFLRFYHVSTVPPALNSDEVAIGYNAYSILKTGRDEYGIRFPLTFRSFDDYKMPVYVYMVAGSMKIFGYTDFAVRFPSAFFGTLTVLLTYFFAKELLKRHDVACVSAFFLAISPWSLQFSRSGYEANVAVFFIVLGVYLFLKQRWWLLLSSISLSIAIWTYLTPRIFVPLLALGLGVIYWKELWKQKYFVLGAIFIAIMLLWPIARMTISPEGQMRATGVSAFANPDDLKKSVMRIALDKTNGFGIFTVFDNRGVTYAITFLRGYFSHFDPNFLFLDKSINKYRAPDMGLLYLFELPFIVTGVYMLVRKWSGGSAVLFWWVLAAPVAAAFTLQLPHPVRTLVFLPAFQILSAVGFVAIWNKFRRIRALIVVGILLFVVYYLHQYYIFLPVENAGDWYVGRREMTEKINSMKDRYDTVYVSNSLDFPYIFYLYYSPIDPMIYQQQGGTVSGGFEEQKNNAGNVQFRSINTSLCVPRKKKLFVGLPGQLFKNSKILDSVKYPDGSVAIIFFECPLPGDEGFTEVFL